MARLKMKSIRELNEKDLQDKLQQMRLRLSAAKGTLRKESGKLKPLRKNIARIKTRLSELKKK
jgi:large subunit ribosomal protein L29